MNTQQKTIIDLQKQIEQLEFHRDEYKKKCEYLERENKMYKSASDAVAPPALMHDSLQTRIDMITAADPDFYQYFEEAVKTALSDHTKSYTVTVLKHNLQDGKWEVCEAWPSDVPDMNLVLDRFGPGRYRFVLRYWTERKKVKGGETKPAWATVFRDLRLGNPVDARLIDIETTDRLQKTIRILVNLAADLGERYKNIAELLERNLTLATLINKPGED